MDSGEGDNVLYTLRCKAVPGYSKRHRVFLRLRNVYDSRKNIRKRTYVLSDPATQIFVVDDEPVIASTLATILQLNGFSAKFFTSPLEALAAARQIHSSEWRLFSLALSEYSLGHTKESEQALQELISKHGHDSAYQVAEVYAWRGESDQAFKWLERAYRQRDNGIGTMQYSPLLSSVREDPRYGEMLRKALLVQ